MYLDSLRHFHSFDLATLESSKLCDVSIKELREVVVQRVIVPNINKSSALSSQRETLPPIPTCVGVKNSHYYHQYSGQSGRV